MPVLHREHDGARDQCAIFCSTNLPTGWTLALAPTTGGRADSSSPRRQQLRDRQRFGGERHRSERDRLAVVVTAAGSPYLVSQTTSGIGTVNKINPPGGTQGGRLTWTNCADRPDKQTLCPRAARFHVDRTDDRGRGDRDTDRGRCCELQLPGREVAAPPMPSRRCFDLAARQERFFTTNNTYTNVAANLGYAALPLRFAAELPRQPTR